VTRGRRTYQSVVVISAKNGATERASTGTPPAGTTAGTWRGRFADAAGRLAGRTSRLFHVGQGGVASALVCLALDPSAARRLAAGREIVLVSGTNGKTTTTRMIATALGGERTLATNTTGANLKHGLVTALLDTPGSDVAVLEVDEAVVPWALEHLRPSTVVLLNLSRDQLDRHNETAVLADLWLRSLSGGVQVSVIANADDPLVVHAALDADTTWVAAGTTWIHDAITCPRCGDMIDHRDDTWACVNCDFARPEPSVRRQGDVVSAGGESFELRLRLPGEGARSNAAMALGALQELGSDLSAAVEMWSGLGDIEGRYSRTRVGGHDVYLTLAKNPAGWLDILSTTDDGDSPMVIGLNANGQDGTDPSWIWDVPFERLAGRHIVCVGDRALDLLVRLRYASLECTTADGLLEALAACPDGPVEAVGNYSAFQEFRVALRRG
jgi:UDP-N-acetylmuramyl tripeptide synthase